MLSHAGVNRPAAADAANARAAVFEFRLMRVVPALLVAGLVVRLLWLLTSPANFAALGGESDNIAKSLVRNGLFGDAFGAGQGTGPTAHLVPTTPLMITGVYQIFGIETPLALWTLSILSIVIVLYGLWLFCKAFERLGSPIEARLLAVAIVALVPLQFSLEARVFRSWEGGIATLLVAAVLLWLLRLDERRTVDTPSLVALGIVNGAVAVISVAAGLATSGMIGVLLLRRVSWRRWPIAVAASVIMLMMVVVPWAMRNDRMLGAPVLLRTGLGISMAIGYNDYQLGPDRGVAYDKAMHEFHPHLSAPAREQLRRVGEIAFNRALQADAQAWIDAHPDATRRLRIENLRDFFFPPRWHFERFNAKGKAAGVRVGLLWAATAFGFATLFFNLWRRRWRYLYPAAAVVLPCLPYIYALPLLRYRYVVSTLLIFLACEGVVRLLIHLRAGRSKHFAQASYQNH